MLRREEQAWAPCQPPMIAGQHFHLQQPRWPENGRIWRDIGSDCGMSSFVLTRSLVTRAFFSFISVSVAAPTLLIATPPTLPEAWIRVVR